MIARRLNLLWPFALSAFLAVGAISFAADAQGMDTIDPAQIRFITPTESTSKCIGDPRTPVCAAETVLACALRVDNSLCEKVGVTDYRGPDRPTDFHRYRVLSVQIVRPEDITPDLRAVDWWKPNFARITIQDLDFRPSWCPDGCKVFYMAKPTQTGWHVISWAVEGAAN